MLNKWTGIGRVGNAPEMHTFDSGDKAAKFSIACYESWKDKNGEKKEKTEWVNIVIYGKLADIVERYVTKGMLLYIEGKLATRSYDVEGCKRYVTEVILNGFGSDMKMLSSNKNEGTSDYAPPPPPTSDETDDLPF